MRARTSTVSPTFGSPTIFVFESTRTPRPAIVHAVDVIVSTGPRHAMSSGGVAKPKASTAVARRPPEFTTETVANMPAARSPIPVTGPFGPSPDHFVGGFVDTVWKRSVSFPPAASTDWIVPASWPARVWNTTTLVAARGGGGNTVGITSGTVTVSYTHLTLPPNRE